MQTTRSNKRRNWIVLALAGLCFWLVAGSAAWAATRTWTGAAGDGKASTAGNWSPNGAPTNTDDIVLDGTSPSNLTWDAAATNIVASWTQTVAYTGTVTFAMGYAGAFTNFTIAGNATVSNGVWTHTANPAGSTAAQRLYMTVNGNLTIGTNAVIQADAKGFLAGYGPGKGVGARHGGGYGGIGACYFDGATANYTPPTSATYGLIPAPSDPGSGGQSGGTAGGGAIFLGVTGDLVLNGTVSAGGGDGWIGGSGGSVYIRAATLTGGTGGVVRANGGSAGSNAGSGGGGRVAVVLTGVAADFTAFTGRMTATGGDTSNAQADGAAGTVYKETLAQGSGLGTLLIDNANRDCAPGVFTLMPASVNVGQFTQVVITNKGNLAVDADDTLNFGTASIIGAGPANAFITITNATGVTFPNPYTLSGYTLSADALTNVTGNWLIASNGALSHTANVISERYSLSLTINGNLTIASNGAVNADGLGYFHGYGPGTTALTRHGGSHGGVGGTYAAGGGLAPTGTTYGSVIAPTNLGSGANAAAGKGMNGGGAVRITVTGALTNQGTISANGVGWPPGAGGSVYVTAGSLAGNGTVRANGGDNGGGNAGSGGGGRVAAILTGGGDFSGFTGTMTARGGDCISANEDGAAGTVYKQSGTNKQLIVANFTGNSITTNVVTPVKTTNDLLGATVFVTNKTVLALATNSVFGDLYLQSATSVMDLGSNATCNGYMLTIKSFAHALTPGYVTNYGTLVWAPDIAGAPELVNGSAMNILDTAAAVSGTLVSNAATVFLFRSTNDWTTNEANWIASGAVINLGTRSGGESFTNTLSGLTPNTRYYWNHMASNVTAKVWAATLSSPSFKTCGQPGVDNTNGATVVRWTTATLNGNLTNGGIANVFISWWTNGASVTNLIDLGAPRAEGGFSTNVTGLTVATEYGYRCFASNAYGTAWAAAATSFTTLPQQLVWSGAGSNSLASNPSNWVGHVAPQVTDRIWLDGTSSSNMTWDTNAPSTVLSWTQQPDYTGTVTFAMGYTNAFTNFTIVGNAVVQNGVWTHTANPAANTAAQRLYVTVNGDLTLGTNAVIQADGSGFPAGYGPGRGVSMRDGGGYGGLGGIYANGTLPSSAVYGSLTAPTDLGSGPDSGSGKGGGAIYLGVSSNLVLHGVVSANGIGNSGGSGGSVYIRAATITGWTGAVIRAAGGNSGLGGNFAGGGGGRVAVVLTGAGTDFGGFGGSMEANGGIAAGTAPPYGAAGTVYRETLAQGSGHGTLVIDNANLDSTMVAAGVFTLVTNINLGQFSQIVITNKGNLAIGAGTTLDFGTASIGGAGASSAFITIANAAGVTFPASYTLAGYTLVPDNPLSVTGNWLVSSNGGLTHMDNYDTERHKLVLVVNGNLTILSNGAVNVDGLGYDRGKGPGTSGLDRHGGSYGGVGGTYVNGGSLMPTGTTYGSIVAPTNLGSGANGSFQGSGGGGAVLLTVTGALTNNGTISANGIGYAPSAGGSVFLRVGSLVGNGTIRANGGDNSGGNAGGGGGGRVAVILAGGGDLSGYTGTITARGGDSSVATEDGAAGTVYKQTPAGQQLIVANFAGNSLVNGVVTDVKTPTDLRRTTVMVTNKTVLALATNSTFGDLLLQSANSYFQLAGYTGTVSTLTITNSVFRDGTYTTNDLGPLVLDSSPGGTGRVIVRNPLGTVFKFR